MLGVSVDLETPLAANKRRISSHDAEVGFLTDLSAQSFSILKTGKRLGDFH
jgi:hypothetical protein